jgi:hypothetical protein
MTDSLVVSPGKSEVFLIEDVVDVRIGLLYLVAGSVGGPVIHENHVKMGVFTLKKRIQAVEVDPAPVPIQHHGKNTGPGPFFLLFRFGIHHAKKQGSRNPMWRISTEPANGTVRVIRKKLTFNKTQKESLMDRK